MVTHQTIVALLKAPNATTYGALLREVIEDPEFNLNADDLRVLWQRFHAGDFAGVRNSIPGRMRLWAHSPEIHVLAAAVARRLGDEDAASFEGHFARCCYQGLQATGDGSVDQPYQVARVTDEYALLRFLDKAWSRQGMFERDGRVIDVFTCSDGTTLHFQLPRADLLTGRVI